VEEETWKFDERDCQLWLRRRLLCAAVSVEEARQKHDERDCQCWILQSPCALFAVEEATEKLE
jgi:hypothetical protein